MIQRIQSVYYLLAALSSFVLYAQPFVLFSSDAGVFELFACHLSGPADHNVSLNLLPLTISATVAALLSFIAIFMYKNRKLQLRLGRFSLFGFVVVLGLQGAFYYIMSNITANQGQPAFAAAMPLVCIIFVALANRGVKKDEALIRSADRIR